MIKFMQPMSCSFALQRPVWCLPHWWHSLCVCSVAAWVCRQRNWRPRQSCCTEPLPGWATVGAWHSVARYSWSPALCTAECTPRQTPPATAKNIFHFEGSSFAPFYSHKRIFFITTVMLVAKCVVPCYDTTRWCRVQFNGYRIRVCLVQDCSNSSALAMELLQSCTQHSIW